MRISLSLGEHRVGKANGEEWVIFGLGSCVGLILCDPRQRISAMAHIVLPRAHRANDFLQPGKYVNTAVPFLIEEMVALGADRSEIYAQAAGGARMLALGTLGEIGVRNVDETRAILNELKVPLVAEQVGGTKGRTLWWNVAKGQAIVRRVGEPDEVLTPEQYVYGEVSINGPHFGR